MPWIDEGDGIRSWFDIARGVETKRIDPMRIDPIPVDPYDELDDFGNLPGNGEPTPEAPSTWWDPGTVPAPVQPRDPFPDDPWFTPLRPPFERGDPDEPTHGFTPPFVPPPPIPFDPEVQLRPAVPQESPAEIEHPDAGNVWDKLTPGSSTTPGEMFEDIKPFGAAIGLTGMLPLLIIGMLFDKKE